MGNGLSCCGGIMKSDGTKIAFATAIVALIAGSAMAQGEAWTLTQSRVGTPIARLQLDAGSIRVIELACNGPRIAIGVQPSRPVAARALPVGFKGDRGAMVAMTLPRLGAGQSFAGHLPDTRLLDGLSGEWTAARVATPAGAVVLPVAGAAGVVRAALARCWTPRSGTGAGGVTASSTPAPAAGAAIGEVMGTADESSPDIAQTSFPLRDPRSGRPRLPVKLGAWVPAPGSCARPRDLMFVDIGVGLGEGEPAAQNAIGSIRQTRPGVYTAVENIGVNGDADSTQTYTVRDPEHVAVRSAGQPSRSYSWCAQSALPIGERRFLDSEHRRVPAVPIRAGYYAFYEGDQPLASAQRCRTSCGFALITRAGVATVYRRLFGAAPRREDQPPPVRFRFVTQTAPRLYVGHQEPAVDAGASRAFEVRGPDEFTSPADGEGEIVRYERVDRAAIPAGLVPRL